MRLSVALTSLLFVAASAAAQHPLKHAVDAVEMRFALSQPVVAYTLHIDSADLSGWSVQMDIRNAPDSFQLAMARHPEYDDRYRRFVEDIAVSSARGLASIAHTDSALWTVRAPGGDVVVRYRIHMPPPERLPRAAWRPFLTPTGGLTGGPHSFMYVVGATLAPSHVKLELPRSWSAVTALTRTTDPTVFFAPSVDVLVESPILVGRMHDWSYRVDGVPHRVVYWSAPAAVAFDTITFVSALEKLTREAVTLFGRAPYRDYTFMFQDAAYGGLEHAASVTLGAPSDALAKDPLSHIEEAAHEYLHTWNLMRIRPAEYAGVDYLAPTPSAGLWFSEGLTIYYADALLRRAGIVTEQPTRDAHLKALVERYLDNPGAARLSAEAVSRVAYNAGPMALGDYAVSTHMQGEMIGTMLDFIIRDATNGARSMDDVMRLMLERYSGETGFTGRDIERVVGDVCQCSVKAFFDAHVRGGNPIDVAPYLRLAGLQLSVGRAPVLRDGAPVPELRVVGWNPEETQEVLLRLLDPSTAWGRAGLHTGDRIVAMNGTSFTSWPELRAFLTKLRIGDSVDVIVMRRAGRFETRVHVAGYERPVATITAMPGASPKQVAIRDRWLRGW